MHSLTVGMSVLVLLNLLALLAGAAVAGRAKMEGRAETLLTTLVVWTLLVIVPTHSLGYLQALHPWLLAAVSFATSTGAFVLSGLGRSPRDHAAHVLADLKAMVRLPWDAFALFGRTWSFTFVAAFACVAMLLWTGFLTYLGPPSGWDGLWYHDSITSFAVQNHGFRLVDLPDDLQIVNGFPRICETMNLWFVIFTDRRLIELPNTIMAVPLMLAVYVMVRRYTHDIPFAAGIGCALLLMPGSFLELRSTYIDVTAGAIYASALHYSTRPQLRLRDVWLAALCLGLLLGTKFPAIVYTPMLGSVVLVRLFWHHYRRAPLSTVITFAGGLAALCAIGLPNYARNWTVFHDLIWPYQVELPFLHTQWKAPRATGQIIQPADKLLGTMFGPPVPGKDWPDIREHGYGLGLPLLMLPLGVLALLKAGLEAVIAPLRRPSDGAFNLLYTALPPILTIPVSPSLSFARYNIHIVVGFVVAGSWLVGRLSSLRIREGIVAAITCLSLILLHWAEPCWSIDPKEAAMLWDMSPRQRAGFHVEDFLPEPRVVEERESLKPGDIVAFTDHFMFLAIHWNEHFSNRVVYVPSSLGPDGVIERALELRAKWISVTNYSPEFSALRARPGTWREVGQLSTTNPAQVVFAYTGSP